MEGRARESLVLCLKINSNELELLFFTLRWLGKCFEYSFELCLVVFCLQFVIVSLTGWGLTFYGGYKLFSGGKKEEVL